MRRQVLLLNLLGCLFFSNAVAQDFQLSQKAKEVESGMKESYKLMIPIGRAAGGIHLLDAVHTPSCSNIPSAAQATNFSDHSQYYDRELAASLKINYVGTVSVDADNSSLVFARRYTRFARCPATDGTGNLLYGDSLTASVLVNQIDASAGANFAVAAGSATVKSRSVQVLFDANGITDANVATADGTAQSLTQSGLKVDNYGDFDKATAQAFSAAIAANIASMEPVGFEPNIDVKDVDNLRTSLATAFALDRIAQGWGCEDAVKTFNTVFPDDQSKLTEAAIRATYNTLAHGCDASSPLAKASAEAIINGQRLLPKR